MALSKSFRFILSLILLTWLVYSKDDKLCSKYLEIESDLQCSSKGVHYLSSYGYKYCNEFRRNVKKWKHDRKTLSTWGENVSNCLVEMLSDNPRRLNPCPSMKKLAFSSHSICYSQYNFCSLDDQDMRRVLRVIDKVDLFGSFTDSLRQALDMGCMNKILRSFSETLFWSKLEQSKAHWNKTELELVDQLLDRIPINTDSKFYDEVLLSFKFDIRDIHQIEKSYAVTRREAENSNVNDIQSSIDTKMAVEVGKDTSLVGQSELLQALELANKYDKYR